MKNGTPLTPIACACSISSRTRSTSAPSARSFHELGVKAAFAGDLDQNAAVADVASLDEIGLEQPIDDFCLYAGRARPSG